jgi:hypothetical protein
MTPQEKAKELFKKMYQVRSVAGSDITKYFAKQCALIAVNELLEECRLERDWYWDRVKTEIENL